ncbi:hypothetical protein C7H83_04520 [Tetragenococcus halophilus]|uniref:NAD(P)-binding domain-containing protein n=1 Tax=Tetragenococcus halophilus TaxID=51669 RepID=A0A3G5FHS5_TETHA|nr:NAD(P)H-binding protein [Tetragenococcus halophilus]AYW49795.1 hypothetical protein C7H83_04520 [Tetragenococcus halophilus]GBD63105.1 hypothetical protein TEHD23766T_0532 [Tetragenococcus halophilus subsp. flandriensis]
MCENVLVLRADDYIARLVISRLLNETNVNLTLFLRDSQHLSIEKNERVNIVKRDVKDFASLNRLMRG